MEPTVEPTFSLTDIEWYEQHAEAARAEMERAPKHADAATPGQRHYRLDEIRFLMRTLVWHRSMGERLAAYVDGQMIERIAAFLAPEVRRRFTPPFLGSAEPDPDPNPQPSPQRVPVAAPGNLWSIWPVAKFQE